MNVFATPTQQPPSVFNAMAERFGMDRRAFESTIKATIMPANVQVSDEQVAAFLLVAKKYDLNPFTKEIFAFPNRGGIQPIVSIDGWLKIINEHPQFDGLEFEDKLDDKGGLIAVTCRIYRRDRSRPTSVTEYMAECRGNTDTWKRWPARMLRHKAAIQAARYAFGFSGIMDPDEADRLESVSAPAAVTAVQMPRSRSASAPEPAPEPVADDTQDAEFNEGGAGEAEPAAEEQVEPGIHGLSDSQQRILATRAEVAGFDIAGVLKRWPRVDASNLNEVLATLRDLADAA